MVALWVTLSDLNGQSCNFFAKSYHYFAVSKQLFFLLTMQAMIVYWFRYIRHTGIQSHWNNGNIVEINDGPAAVTGDERCIYVTV